MKLLLLFATKKCYSTILSCQQQIPDQNIPAARNCHGTCFLIFRDLGSACFQASPPPPPASHHCAPEQGFPNPVTGPTPSPTPTCKPGLNLGPFCVVIAHSCSSTSPVHSTLYMYLGLIFVPREAVGTLLGLRHCGHGHAMRSAAAALGAHLEGCPPVKPTPRPAIVAF